MTQGKPEETCGDFGGRRNDGRECGRPSGWGTDFSSGKCRECRGTKPDGSTGDGHGQGDQEGNANAVKHGADRKPEYLKSDIVDTRHEDTFHAAHEALCSRYERMHGIEPDFALRKDLEEIALAYVKRDMIDAYARDKAEEGDTRSPLVERQVIGVDDDGRPISVEQTNKLQNLWTDLRRETRLLMRDLGLYHDPESQKAEATESLATLLSQE